MSDATVPPSFEGVNRCRLPSDNRDVAEKHAVECLRCGSFRAVERERTQRLDPGECPECGYVGWALFTELNEATRRTLRERPPERRGDALPRLRPV